MAVQVSYPGVYIEEFAPGAPIAGVGTSTAALIGVAARGEMKVPTLLTSWDTFRTVFGQQPVPGFHLWYAVRGFFENGGAVCYIVRASNGDYDSLVVMTRAGAKPLLTVRARDPGVSGISLQIDPTHLVDATRTTLYRPVGALTVAANGGDKQLLMTPADAALFRPGDAITIAATGEQLQVMRVSSDGTTGTLLLDRGLAGGHAVAAQVRLDDSKSGAQTFRLVSTAPLPPGALVAGTLLTFVQGTNANTQVVAAVQAELLAGGATTWRVTLRQGLSFPVDMTAAATVQSEELKFSVRQGAATTVYDGLGFDAAHARFYLDVLNGDLDGLVQVAPIEPPPPVGLPGNLPATTALTALAGGAVENLTTIADQDFIDALDTLHGVGDVNMVAVPDRPTPAVQQAVIAHCELLGDRFAVLDCRPGLDPFKPSDLQQQRAETTSARGYAALYYPWLRVPPVGPGAPILVPPSGHMCGIYARVDTSRGVHKAPANEVVNGALGVERVLSDIDHGQLNRVGIDVTRVFKAGARPLLFGARTTASDANWQYVNIRRLFLYLEKSIQQGIAWAVFEPNNKALWQKLRRSIGDFLNQAWRDGALFGAKAEEAYYVRIDDTLNPFSEQQLGRLHIEIGVRPTYPAEFIVVRIGIWDGGADVSEG